MNILDCISPNSCRQRKINQTNLSESTNVFDPSQKENTEEFSELAALTRLKMNKMNLINSTIWSGRKDDNCKASQKNLSLHLESTDDQEFYKTKRLSEILLTRPTN